MPFFSEREQGPRPTTAETISLSCWRGILSVIRNAIKDGSFALSYPEHCPDGPQIYATDEREFEASLDGHALPPLSEDLPQTFEIMDLIEFCHEKIAKPIPGSYHSFFSHAHLGFNKAAGQQEFRDMINRILGRNGMAYKINDSGQIERLAPPALHEALVAATFKTGDSALDDLLEVARKKFLNPRSEVRKEALEKLWDAWERLKTLEDPSDKKRSADTLLGKAANEQNFKTKLDEEARALTKIGNEFMIRHHETDKTPISVSEHVDYLFHRMFALIRLLLRATNRGG